MADKKKISQPSLRNLASGDVQFREGEVDCLPWKAF